MHAVMEADKSFVESLAYKLRTASNTQQIKFSPTYPYNVSNAVIYYRLTDRITTLELGGNSYIVVSGTTQPTAVLGELKKLAGSKSGYCQILNGVQANDIAYVANEVR